MISGYGVYYEYSALKQHFTGTYNYIKYKGKLKSINPDTWEKRKDKNYYRSIGQKLQNRNECIQFFTINFSRNNIKWIGDYNDDDFDLMYNVRGRLKNFEVYFKDNIRELHRKGVINNDRNLIKEKLCTILENDFVETFVILIDIYKIKRLDKYNEMYYNVFWRWIEHYKSFFNVDEEKYRDIIKEII